MRQIRLTSTAEEDLTTATGFYDLQEPGAGDLLFAAVLRVLRRLETAHGFHRKRHGFYKVLVRGFPYAVYYELLKEDLVVVVAILDERQAPSSIREQFKIRRRNSSGDA